MVQRLLRAVAGYPPLWDAARRVIEAGHRGEREAIERELGGLPGSVLDLPCGTGIFSPLFGDADYVGVDLSEALLVHARRKFPGKRFCVGDATDLALPDDSFDRVLMVGFLHHLSDAKVRHALREVKRVLRPGGRFLLVEDAPRRSRWNLGRRLLQVLDAGDHVRPTPWYERELRESFELERAYPARAGLWDYTVYVLR